MPPKPRAKANIPSKRNFRGAHRTVAPQPTTYKGKSAKKAPIKYLTNGQTLEDTKNCIHNAGKTGLKVGG